MSPGVLSERRGSGCGEKVEIMRPRRWGGVVDVGDRAGAESLSVEVEAQRTRE